MTKRYVEVTIAYEDDPTLNPNNVVEVSHRTKEGDGAWSPPTETLPFALRSSVDTPWLKLGIEKV